MANVPTKVPPPGMPVEASGSTSAPPAARTNAPAFDSIAPGVSLPAAAVPPPVAVFQLPPQEHHAPGEWFTAILIHQCTDPAQILCEVYPSEPEAEAAAMRMRQKYFKGQDSRTFGSMCGCEIELFVAPAYLHGIEATNRVFSLGHG